MAHRVIAPNAPKPGLDEPRLIEDSGLAQRIGRIAEPVLRDVDLRLVRVRVSSMQGATVQVMAERADGTMSIEDCALASDMLSPSLDFEDPIAGAYRLEVSSPGIDRPLVRLTDFRRAVGHEAKIEMATPVDGRKRFRGVIEAVVVENEAPVVALKLIDSKSEEDVTARLAVKEMAEARLVLTETLIRQALRREKDAIKQRKAERRERRQAEKPSGASGKKLQPRE